MKQIPKSKAEAISLGEKYYFTGKPCKRNHFCKRTIYGQCIDCKKINIKKFWNANKGKAKEYYWKNPDKKREYSRNDYHKRKNEINRKRREFRVTDAESVEKRRQKEAESAALLEKNITRKKLALLCGAHNRRAKQKGIDGKIRVNELLLVINKQKFVCAFCGVGFEKCLIELDHIKPFRAGGDNNIKNIQFLCRTCNRRKSGKFHEKS